MNPSLPTVTVAVPTLNEAAYIDDCLEAVAAQTYPRVTEILVVDGGSVDDTRERAARHPGVAVLDNPRRIQAAALNIALRQARGEVFVRVDGHCRLEPDYVAHAVAALDETGAAIVGGAMTPVATTGIQQAVAAAMRSRAGAGPAHFHRSGGSRWTDTVYLGVYRTDLARELGGYAEDVGVNEDAEFAYRLARRGGVWYDVRLRSHYWPRSSIRAVARQFFRYGLSRAMTVKKHPESLRPRQLAPPALLLGLAGPARRRVASLYSAVISVSALVEAPRAAQPFLAYLVILPIMHLAWGTGFILGLTFPPARRIMAPVS